MTESFHVPSISCPHCVATIRRELGELDGITQVDADLASKTVKVQFKPPMSREKLIGALIEIGHPPEA